MSDDLDVLERLHTDPAPAMHVSVATVLAEARRRQSRRMGRRVAVLAAAAVAATVAAVLVLAPDDRGTKTPPAATTTTRDLSISGNGGARISGTGGAYSVWITGGTVTTAVTRPGGRPVPGPSATVLPSGAMWVGFQGTTDLPVLVGVVPAGATDIDILSAGIPRAHSIRTARAGDFEAFLVEFAEPAKGADLASDITWRESGTAYRALSLSPGEASFDVTGAGRLTVSLEAGVPSGGPVSGRLDETPLVQQPVIGATPDDRYSLGKHDLPGGRVLVWGVVPQQTLTVWLDLTGGATAGTPSLRPLAGNGDLLAYAVVVEGRATDVTRLRSTDRSGEGIGDTD